MKTTSAMVLPTPGIVDSIPRVLRWYRLTGRLIGQAGACTVRLRNDSASEIEDANLSSTTLSIVRRENVHESEPDGYC
jgi:hypothetical protein